MPGSFFLMSCTGNFSKIFNGRSDSEAVNVKKLEDKQKNEKTISINLGEIENLNTSKTSENSQTIKFTWQIKAHETFVAKTTNIAIYQNDEGCSEPPKWSYDVSATQTSLSFNSVAQNAFGLLQFRITTISEKGEKIISQCSNVDPIGRVGINQYSHGTDAQISPYYFGSNVIPNIDINNDGIADTVTVGYTGTINISLGNNSNSVPEVRIYSALFNGVSTSVIGLGDFNGDGIDDIAISSGSESSSSVVAAGGVHFFFGQVNLPPSGPLAEVTKKVYGEVFAGNYCSFYFRVTDFNQDGIDDIICGSFSRQVPDYSIDIIIGRTIWPDEANGSAGGFHILGTGSDNLFAAYAYLADTNSDGHDDLVITASNKVYIILSSTNISTRNITAAHRKYTNCYYRIAGDPDDDGDVDLIFSAGSGIYVLESASGTLPASNSIGSTGAKYYSDTAGFTNAVVILTDLTGDSKKDILVSNSNYDDGASTDTGFIGMIKGGSTLPTSGSFQARGTRIVGDNTDQKLGHQLGSTDRAPPTDINNDGFLDYIVGSGGTYSGNVGGYIAVIFGVGGNALPADGKISERGVVIYSASLDERFSSRVHVEDVTGDGHPDIIASSGLSVPVEGFIHIIPGGPSFPSASGSSSSVGTRIFGDSKNFKLGHEIQFKDLTGDGILDIISDQGGYTTLTDVDRAHVYIITGRNNFGASGLASGKGFKFESRIFKDSSFFADLQIKDIDADGKFDILLSSGAGDVESGTSEIFFGPISADSKPVRIFDSLWGDNYFGVPFPTISDLDGDGIQDITFPSAGSTNFIRGARILPLK